MAFADWVVQDDNTFAASLNVSTPIVGSGSYSSSSSGSLSDSAQITYLNSGSFAKGYTKGRLRSLFRRGAGYSDSQTADHFIGFFFMAEIENFIASQGDYYFVGLRTEGGTTYRPRIVKATNALARAVDTEGFLEYSASTITYNIGDVLPMQVDWVLDQAQLGGMRITLSLGNIGDLDYSNLTTIYDIIDGSPFTTSVNEGFFQYFDNATAGVPSTEYWAFDNTGVFQLV